MRRLLAPLLVLAFAAPLAGCSGQTTNKSADDFKGDQKAVAQVVDDLGNAGKKGDAKEICTGIFTRQAAARLKQGTRDCQDVVNDQLKDANVFTLDVKSVEVSGDTATAQVSSKFDGHDQLRQLRLRKQGTTWRLASMSGPS